MKLTRITCPSCNAEINLDVTNRKTVFCSYCGSQIAIDDGNRTFTRNINVNKSVTVHKVYTDEARIEEARAFEKENEREHKETIVAFIFAGLAFLVIILIGLFSFWGEKKAVSDGKIQVGFSYSEFTGKDYRSAIETLEAQGFTNITTIDLNDAGLFFKKENTIEKVTIDGKESFSSTDYYFPDSKIVITYH